ncbi:ATP-binding protein [Streptomyces stramineus]
MPVPAPDTRPSLLGRDHWLRVLRAHIDRASSGSGGLVLVTGEAGIGKTSLVGRAIQEGESRGLCVLRGSCWDADSTPGYWPWTQVFRGLRRGAGEGDGEAGAGTALPALLGACATDGQTDRFQLFDAATTQLSAASRQRPVLVVLEDLHWADPASVGLLDFAAQHIRFERLLILATCRDAEIERPGHPLRPLFRSLATRATTVPLTGLGEADVAELMQRTAGTRPAEDVVGEVRRRTGGNPFFVQEAARLWAAGHAVTAISPGLRASLEQRLSLLAPPVAECLGAASVLGRQFRPGTLARVLGAPSAQVAQWLAEAVDAQLVERAEGAGFAFKHDLVRETLYDALGADRARRLHAAAVAALRDAGSAQSGARPTELAHHAYLAFEELDRDEAVALLVSAARDAESRVAQEEAAGHFARALERAGEKPGPGRVLLALDFGLSLQLVGDHERSWAVFADAVRLAEGLADPLLVGRTALTLFGADGQGDTGLLKSRALHRAHALLVPGPPAEPALDVSQSRLAREVARRVVAAARAAGDDDALHIGLWARLQAEWGPRVVRDRPALAQELIAVARRRGDRWTEHVAMSMLWVAALEADDPRFLEHFHAMVEVAAASGSPRMRLTAVIDRSVVDAVTGRFTEAAHLLDTAVSLSGSPAGYYQYFTFHHRWALLLLRGRFTEARALHGELREHGHPYVDLLEAITELEAGEGPTLPVPRPGAARAVTPSCTTASLPCGCAIRPRAPRLPGTGRGASRYGTPSPRTRGSGWSRSTAGTSAGPRPCGRVSSTRRWGSGTPRCDSSRRPSGPPIACTPVPGRYGRDSNWPRPCRHERPGARRPPCCSGRRQRRRAGSGWAIWSSAPTPPQRPAAARGAAADEFRRDGSVWRLTFRGRTVHVPDAKGLHDLHCLLGRPGEDIAAARLLDPHHDTTAEAAGAMGADDILDEETKRRYRLHLQRLDAEIDQAVKLGDDSRAAAYDRERAALLEELRRSTGLAGRSRRLGDASERARKNVTARIRDTLRRLDERHPELAAHLREAVSTGTTCRYAPDAEIRWRL